MIFRISLKNWVDYCTGPCFSSRFFLVKWPVTVTGEKSKKNGSYWKQLKYTSIDSVFYADSEYHNFITQNLLFDDRNSELWTEIWLLRRKFSKNDFSRHRKKKRKSTMRNLMSDDIMSRMRKNICLHQLRRKTRYVYKNN